MNPALPAVVYTIPTCCSDAAANRTSPATASPHAVPLRSPASGSRRSRRRRRSGTSDALPRRNRTPLNVNGPTCSIPARWATNANPQITEASRS